MSSYSGSIKTVVDRVYWELTGGANGGRCIDTLMSTTLPNGQPMLQIVIRDRQDLPAGQFQRIVIDNNIGGGIVYINRTGIRLDGALELLAHELYGHFTDGLFRFSNLPADTLGTNDWGEANAYVSESALMQYLQQNYGLNLIMKDTPTNVAILERAPTVWSSANSAGVGYMSVWAQVLLDSSLVQKLQPPNAELTYSDLESVLKPKFQDPAVFYAQSFTDAMRSQVSAILVRKVSPTSDRDTFVSSLGLP